jgi:eukaryotic-like serine/threonine-protein kinase
MTLGRPGVLLAGRYRLDRPMSDTDAVERWQGYDQRLARAVAVRLDPAPAADDAAWDGRGGGGSGWGGGAAQNGPAAVQTVLARLNHPGVAAVYDVGTTESLGGRPVGYAISEWAEGRTLGQVMASGPQPWPRTADWGRQIAGALAALHSVGIVHGALGPNSVVIHDDRQVKILDAEMGTVPAAPASGDTADTAVLTVPAVPPGSAQDVWALGALVWEATVGNAPLPGLGGLNQRPLTQVGAPTEFTALLMDLLAEDPAARPTAAAAERRFVPLAAAADRVGDAPTGTVSDLTPTALIEPQTEEEKRRRGLWIGLLLLLAALGVGVGLLVANLGNTDTTTPVVPTATTTVSPGKVTLPSGTAAGSSAASQAPISSAAPVTSAAPSTATTSQAPTSAAPSQSSAPASSASPSTGGSADASSSGEPPTSGTAPAAAN